MATISITIADADLPRVIHALCVTAGVAETAANARQVVVQRVKDTVLNVEWSDAVNSAQVTYNTKPVAVIT